jgi:hypothetical protein
MVDRVNVEGVHARFTKERAGGSRKSRVLWSFEEGPPACARYSLCEPVFVCLSLFTSLSKVVAAAVTVKILQPTSPGTSRLSPLPLES